MVNKIIIASSLVIANESNWSKSCMGTFFFTCRPPTLWSGRRRAQPKSCFKSAENRAASSLGVDGHRYTRISCLSKLLWVQGDLKSYFFPAINSLKSIQRSRETLENVQNWASSSFRYEYGVIQFNFVRVKTQMGLQQFETEPRTQTPFDRFYVRLLFDFQFASEPYMKNDSEWSTK